MESAFALCLSTQWLELCSCLYELHLWTRAWTKGSKHLENRLCDLWAELHRAEGIQTRISWEPQGSRPSAESIPSIFPLKVTFDMIYLQIPMGPLPPYLLSLANCSDLSSSYILFILVGEEGWAMTSFTNTKSRKHSF